MEWAIIYEYYLLLFIIIIIIIIIIINNIIIIRITIIIIIICEITKHEYIELGSTVPHTSIPELERFLLTLLIKPLDDIKGNLKTPQLF